MPGLTLDRVALDAARIREVARALVAEGWAVSYLGSTFLPAEETVFDFLEADLLEHVHELDRRASAGFDRVSVAVSIPSDPSERRIP